MVGISPDSVCYCQYGWYLTQCCPSWTNWLSVYTIKVGISTGFVCHGQYWFVYLPVVFVMNYNGWYITQFCLSWTLLVDISHSIVSHGQY